MKRETKRDNNIFNVEYTNKDIMEKIEIFRTESLKKINELIVQTTKTNGRVNLLEEERDMLTNQWDSSYKEACKRMDNVEHDIKYLSWKVAGIAATAGIIVSLITFVLNRII